MPPRSCAGHLTLGVHHAGESGGRDGQGKTARLAAEHVASSGVNVGDVAEDVRVEFDVAKSASSAV